jgi:hypothetical protein
MPNMGLNSEKEEGCAGTYPFQNYVQIGHLFGSRHGTMTCDCRIVFVIWNIPKPHNSVSFCPNNNQYEHSDQITKRRIFTKGIRNQGKFEPSILVAQKGWCLGVCTII